jgi:hypothetical protein
VLAALSVLLMLDAVPASADQRAFAPDRDTYVTAARPAATFGSAAKLRADALPEVRSYLRFDVSLPAGATITGAVLRLNATSVSTSSGFEVHRVTDTGWDERTLTFADAPALGARLAVSGAWSTAGTVSVALPAGEIRAGPNSFAVTTASASAKAFSSRESASPPELEVTYSSAPAAKIVLAAGDIQPAGTTYSPTAPLLETTAADAVLTLGDLQYETGALADFNAFYSQTWGRPGIKSRTYPSPGNHERASDLLANYCAYFRTGMNGPAAVDPCPGGTPYYSFDLGAWHLVSLDSSRGTIDPAQRAWLRRDLAAHAVRCTLAYWHHPRYSGSSHGNHRLGDVWVDLMAAGVDVVLAGHDHNYQRFARMDNAGRIDPVDGIRSFVVGTGGKSQYATRVIAGQEAADDSTHGVLRLALAAGGYEWRFLPEAGGTFTDAGEEACH